MGQQNPASVASFSRPAVREHAGSALKKPIRQVDRQAILGLSRRQ